MERIIIRKSRGIITHVIVGWIAATVSSEWNAKQAKIVGVSSWPNGDGTSNAYWDISLDCRCILHILKEYRHGNFRPYFFAEVPF